ncbi:MAG: glycosyltransferase, partial [Bacteroidota bacterium]
IRLAINGITSFSDKPLRIATQFGIWISIGSFFAIIWVLLTRFVFQTTVPGWASSLLVMLLLGGVQIFFLGIIGTYISRIHAEVRNRPRYLVKQVYSFSDGNSDE